MLILASTSSERVAELLIGAALVLAGIACILMPSVLARLIPEKPGWKSEFLARRGLDYATRTYPLQRRILLWATPLALFLIGIVFVVQGLW